MTTTTPELWTGARHLRVGPPASRRWLRDGLQWLDVASLVAAFGAGFLFEGSRSGAVTPHEFLSLRLRVANFALLVGLAFAWHLVFRAVGVYYLNRPLLGLDRSLEALRAVGYATLLLALSAVLFRVDAVTPSFLVLFGCIAGLLVLGARMSLRLALRTFGRSVGVERQVLVAGTGPRALALAREIEGDAESRARVVGFVDDEWPGITGFRASGRPLVADLKNLAAHLREYVVDEVVIALPLSVLLRHRTRILAVCAEQGITVRFPLSLVADLRPRAGRRRDDMLLTVEHATAEGWEQFGKRVLDVALSAVLLVLTAPLIGLVALLIGLDSRGPVFFAQERMGLGKRRFRMHKFRTMVVGAEGRLPQLEHLNETEGPTFKLRNDPRVTRIGRFLRRSSIDELPQLWNVLRGEMSLVGPRPLPLRDVEGFEDDRHRRRFSVRPGLTGLWQVSGRNELSFDTWMELDLEYIDRWSLALDLRILARTIPAVLSGRGAE
jgi:exopolysaccharide biosynthesis polyprenyl glycosylphosphotransferase